MEGLTAFIASLIFLVGSQGEADRPTIRTVEFDTATCRAEVVDSLAGLRNPTFLAAVPGDGRRTVLTIEENDRDGAAIVMLQPDDNGHFAVVARRQLTDHGPCHVAVSPDGRYAVTANYGGNSVCIVPFDASQRTFGAPDTLAFFGRGPHPDRQTKPHAHFTCFTPDGRMMWVNDLGTDRIHTYELGADGRPMRESRCDVSVTAGCGPRHTVFGPDGRHAYLITEIGGTVVTLLYDPETLSAEPVAETHIDYALGEGSGHIALSADGRYLYGSNRLRGDGIAVLAVSADGDTLAPADFAATGLHPRHFAIVGNHLIAGARDSNRLDIFMISPVDGTLAPCGTLFIPRPMMILPLE